MCSNEHYHQVIPPLGFVPAILAPSPIPPSPRSPSPTATRVLLIGCFAVAFPRYEASIFAPFHRHSCCCLKIAVPFHPEGTQNFTMRHEISPEQPSRFARGTVAAPMRIAVA
jgi:hypothetical protein